MTQTTATQRTRPQPLVGAAREATSPASPFLTLRGVGLSYGSREVLRNVDLSVAPGELVSVLGPSGSGKSTLLRIAAGLLPPSHGVVDVDGAALRGPRPDVALAFQDPCLLPWLTVERNVAFGLTFDSETASLNQNMKSAYELAMERLQKQSPTQHITDDQKAQIAELENVYKAKKAEREVFLRGEIAKAQAKGEFVDVDDLTQQLARDLRRLDDELESKKEKVRNGK